MDLSQGIEIGPYAGVLLFIFGGIIFVLGGIIASKVLAPHRPNPEKNSTYECGEDPIGSARIQLNNRFYVAALIFLIFDVEVIFLFPWATVYAKEAMILEAHAWGWFALIEVLLFAGILLLGLAYVWVKGDLDWVKPDPIQPSTDSQVPEGLYHAFNERMS